VQLFVRIGLSKETTGRAKGYQYAFPAHISPGQRVTAIFAAKSASSSQNQSTPLEQAIHIFFIVQLYDQDAPI
jgi:hypothetical protein